MRAIPKVVTAVALSMMVLAMMTSPAAAAPIENWFWITLEGSSTEWNVIDPSRSGGDGYTSSGPWYVYPTPGEIQRDAWLNENPNPGWVNQWWYDHPYDPTRYKIVTLNFTFALTDPTAGGGGTIVINYSTPLWENMPNHLVKPPLPEDDVPVGTYIGRVVVENNTTWLEAADDDVYQFSQTYDLRDFGVDYNPEWISVDISGYNIQISSPENPGSIIHDCVPEPTTLLLCGLGGLFSSIRRRRRWR